MTSCHQPDRACRAHERLRHPVSRVMCESANATVLECTRRWIGAAEPKGSPVRVVV
jgi:hypothetical protein